jgi:Tol biopolymer transport system component
MTPSKFLFLSITLLAVGCSSNTTNTTNGGGAGGSGTLYCLLGTSGEIHKLDLGTGAYKKLGFGSGPIKTPEGTIIYGDGNDIVESAEDFTTKRVIVAFDSDVERSNNGEHNPQLSPDAKKVAYQTNDDNTYVVDRQSGEVLARFEHEGVTEQYVHPSWTPDGRIVVNGGFGNPGLFISDAGLTKLTRFDQDLAQPDYARVSPDGTKVAFILQSRVWTVNIDGSGLARMDPQEDSEDRFPTWSPDGSQIAFYNGGRVNIVPAAGGGPVTDLWDKFPELSDKFLIFSTSYQFDWK